MECEKKLQCEKNDFLGVSYWIILCNAYFSRGNSFQIK